MQIADFQQAISAPRNQARPSGRAQRRQSNVLWAALDDTESGLGRREQIRSTPSPRSTPNSPPRLDARKQDRRSPGDILDSAQATNATSDKGTFILSNLRVGGDPYLYLAEAEAVAGFTDPWTFKLSGVMAPQAAFAGELPTLVRVWKSYSGAGSGFADKVERALQGMSLTNDMLGTTIAARQTAEYNATPLWSEAITALLKTRDGEIDGELAASLAKRLSADTNRSWRIVTHSEWR